MRSFGKKGLNVFALVLGILILFSSCSFPGGTEQTTAATAAVMEDGRPVTVSFAYTPSDKRRPLAGFAGQAAYRDEAADKSLVYIDVLWKEIEPAEGVYDFSAFAEENHLAEWREDGRHAVLRFECDKPGEELHMDIPQWLYDKTGDGTFYSADDSHKGYSPDYDNPVFIEAHRKVIAALADYFSDDNFIAFVELGSLGHWGEWHVYYGKTDGATMPFEETRNVYVEHYHSAFEGVHLLMRRPFRIAAQKGLGLFDDTAGKPHETRTFLQWIEKGGDYSPTEEKNALVPMPDFWKNAPVGGEFNSDISFSQMLGVDLAQTMSLLELCHTTFLGPHYPTANSEKNGQGYETAIEKVEDLLGYHLRIRQAEAMQVGDEVVFTLRWCNEGIAPFYYDWPVELYFYNGAGELVATEPLDLALTDVVPGEADAYAEARVSKKICTDVSVYVGIKDPMTDECTVPICIDAAERDGQYLLFKLK